MAVIELAYRCHEKDFSMGSTSNTSRLQQNAVSSSEETQAIKSAARPEFADYGLGRIVGTLLESARRLLRFARATPTDVEAKQVHPRELAALKAREAEIKKAQELTDFSVNEIGARIIESAKRAAGLTHESIQGGHHLANDLQPSPPLARNHSKGQHAIPSKTQLT